MNLPFSREQFFEVFARYNEAVWPAPLWLIGMAAVSITAILWRWRRTDRLVNTVLGILWLWSGVIYHLVFFRRVDSAALIFGVLFVVQAAAFFWCALRPRALHFTASRTEPRTLVGGLVLTYALIIHPLISRALGHHWPSAPTFGAPCPLVLFTLGLLFWTEAGRPRALLIIPLAWAVVGSSAVLEFSMYEDSALLIVGLFAAAMLLPRRDEKLDTRTAADLTADHPLLKSEPDSHVTRSDIASAPRSTGTK